MNNKCDSGLLSISTFVSCCDSLNILALQLTWLDCTIGFCKQVAMTRISHLDSTLQQSVFAAIFCIQNLPFYPLFDLLFDVLCLQLNYRWKSFLWVMKFMKACSTIKLLSFYKIENSKRDNLFDFLKNLLILLIGYS